MVETYKSNFSVISIKKVKNLINTSYASPWPVPPISGAWASKRPNFECKNSEFSAILLGDAPSDD